MCKASVSLKMPYKLVSYLENNELFINVVPNNWEKNNILYWPVQNEGRLRRDENSCPDNSWSTRPCKVKLLDIEKLKDGIELEKKYMELTDSESEERYLRNLETRKRYHQKQSNESTNNIDFNERMLTIAELSSTTTNVMNNQENIVLPDNLYVDSNNPSVQYAVIENNILNENEITNMDNENTYENLNLNKCQGCEDLKKLIYSLEKTVEVMSTEICQVNVKLDKLLGIVKNIPSKTDFNKKEASQHLVESLQLPLKTHDDLMDLENKLSDKEFRSQMINRLCEVGGKDGKGCANQIALKLSQQVFDVELLTNYTWTGSTKHKQSSLKIAFMKFQNIIEMFFETLKFADNNFTRLENEHFFKNKCLKHSNMRLQRQIKAKEKENSNINTSSNLSKNVANEANQNLVES